MQNSFHSSTLYFSPKPSNIDTDKWEEILQKQEIKMTVLSLRDEIINIALEKCLEISKDKDIAKFIVDCAYEAWKKIIHINFLSHDKDENYQNQKWMVDCEPQSCTPDTFAINKIKKEKKIEPKIEDLTLNLDSPPEAEESGTLDSKTTRVSFSVRSLEEIIEETPAQIEECPLDLQFLDSTANLTNISNEANVESASVYSMKSDNNSTFCALKTRKSVLPEIRKTKKIRKSTLRSASLLDPDKNVKLLAQGRVKIQASHSQKMTVVLPPIGAPRSERQSVKSALRIMFTEQRKDSRKSRNISFKNIEDTIKNNMEFAITGVPRNPYTL